MTVGGKSLVTGATGLIGRRLVTALAENVVCVARDPKKAERTLGIRAFAWNGKDDLPAEALEGVSQVFHLAGEPVASGRWSDEKKKRIEESRVFGTRAVVRSIVGRPIALLSASAVGYYGSRGDEVLDEDSGAGKGFLVDVCRAWETEARAHTGRVALVRTGIVLAIDGGALGPMLPLFRAGLGGRLGDGRQWMPWIHIDDIVAMYLHAATHAIEGPLCAVSPTPVTNAAFTKTLGHVLHRPTIFPAPAPILRLALGEMSTVVLASQRVLPKKAEATSFTFRFRDLEPALADVLSR